MGRFSRTSWILFILTAIFAAPPAQAMSEICRYYQENSPEMYKALCTNGSRSTKPAGANSSFSDSFNLNAGSLPTEPSSYGLETIGSVIRNGKGVWSPTFGIVKGFHKFGAGISTSSNNTFYGNDVIGRLVGQPEIDSFEPHETAKGGFTNLNIGTSIQLRKPQEGAAISLGLSARYNKVSDKWGGGPALLVSWRYVTLGAGYSKETISNYLPPLTFTSLLASARYSIFEVEFNRLNDNSNLGLNPIHIFTLTATIRSLTLTASVRELNYLNVGNVTQHHYAIQYLFSKRFSAGFLFNYIPGTNSVGAQFYL